VLSFIALDGGNIPSIPSIPSILYFLFTTL